MRKDYTLLKLLQTLWAKVNGTAYICIILLAISCNRSSVHTSSSKVEADTIAVVQDNTPDTDITPAPDQPFLESLIGGRVLFPYAYRILEETDKISRIINEDWQALYKKNGKYHIGHLPYTIKWQAEEPCSGLPTEEIFTEEHAILFFDIHGLKTGLLDTIQIKNPVIQPENPFQFNFNQIDYQLVASGRKLMYETAVPDNRAYYKLELYQNNKRVKRLLIQNNYNDTQTELKLIADLDGDGLPDFIIASPTNYEENRVLIILSKNSTVYEALHAFDC